MSGRPELCDACAGRGIYAVEGPEVAHCVNRHYSGDGSCAERIALYDVGRADALAEVAALVEAPWPVQLGGYATTDPVAVLAGQRLREIRKLCTTCTTQPPTPAGIEGGDGVTVEPGYDFVLADEAEYRRPKPKPDATERARALWDELVEQSYDAIGEGRSNEDHAKRCIELIAKELAK